MNNEIDESIEENNIGDWAQSPIPNPQSPKLFCKIYLFIY